MATLILPNSIDAFTTADAAEVNQNFQYLGDFSRNDVIHRDGAKSMTGPLILVNSNPADDLHAASRGYVDAFLPIAVIMPYGGNAAPAGGKWMLCDGASLSITAYNELFARLQYRYGGSGGTFKLPDLRGRMPVGVDPSAGRFSVTGKAGGSWLVPIPSHTHEIDHNHGSFTSGSQSVTHTHSIDHNHAAFNSTTDGAHTHQGDSVTDAAVTGGGFRAVPVNTAGASPYNATFTSGGHSHSIDVPNFDGTSGNASVTHNHPVDVPAFIGLSKATELEIEIDDAPTVVKTTTEHVPPYVVLSFIIRVQ